MIGQESFLSKIKSTYTQTSLPHSIILLGDEGSGHLDVCKNLAEFYNLDFYDITELVSQEYINQIYLNANPAMYVVDLASTGEREQNILLKLFEEPNAYTYIVLIGETLYNVLDTIANRGIILNLNKYTREYLSTLVTSEENKEFILDICTTPGQIETANRTDLRGLCTLCSNIVHKINNANFANTLSISNKVNFKDEYDKYDLRLFIKVLDKYILEQKDYGMHKIINLFSKNIIYMNDKRSYFDNLLIKLWKYSRGLKC